MPLPEDFIERIGKLDTVAGIELDTTIAAKVTKDYPAFTGYLASGAEYAERESTPEVVNTNLSSQ